MSECCKKRFIRPDGVWEMDEIIGAKCKVRSMPASNMFTIQDADKTCTVEKIYIRVSLDGKGITTIELEEYPGVFFTWKDLEIVGLDVESLGDRSEV